MKFKRRFVALIIVTTVALDLAVSIYFALSADQSIDHSVWPTWVLGNETAVGGHNHTNSTSNWSSTPAPIPSVVHVPPSSGHTYNFFACQLDFLAPCLIRVTILICGLCFICFSADKHSAIRCVRSLSTPVVCVFFLAQSYGQIKLLALSEIQENFGQYPWFWAIFTSNLFFSIVGSAVWACVLANYKLDRVSVDVQYGGAFPVPQMNVAVNQSTTTNGQAPLSTEDVEPLVFDGPNPNGSAMQLSESQRKYIFKMMHSKLIGGEFCCLPNTAVRLAISHFQIWGFLPKVLVTSPTIVKIAERIGSIRQFNVKYNNLDHSQDLDQSRESRNSDAFSTSMSEVKSDSDRDPVDPKQSMSIMLRLLKYCKLEWMWYTFGFVFLVGNSAARIFVPWYTAQVISDIVVHQSRKRLFQSFVNMVILSVISSVFAGLRSGCLMYAVNKVNVRIRSELFLSLVRQEIGFFDITKTGEIISRLTSDCQVMSDTVASNVNLFLRSLIMLIGALIMMISISWRMTLMVFVILPLIAIISKAYGKYYEKLAAQGQDAMARSNDVADEVLSSMRTVRSFANEVEESKRFDVRLLEALAIGRKKSLAFTGYTWINELIDLFVLAAVLLYGGHLVLTSRLMPENMIAYLLYQLQVAETLINMGSVYTGLMQAVGASRKVFLLIDRKPEIPNNGTVKKAQLHGQIEFKKVTFSYPSRPDVTVLRNVSFTIRPGEICALVGPSGGGKSSCIGLLEHFYEPTSGQILVDKVPVHLYDHSFYHRIVSLVGQEPVLYAKSVAENIAYALPTSEYKNSDIRQAAKLANAHQFIVSLSKGYGTNVGEKGIQISGGQKQRIAIARAIIRKPKVLLLDEATSALDSESEHLVQKALYENLAGYTILLIAHRLSTVRKADRIIVIDKGRVVQQGSHDDLLQEDGLYKSLVQRQLLGESDVD